MCVQIKVGDELLLSVVLIVRDKATLVDLKAIGVCLDVSSPNMRWDRS